MLYLENSSYISTEGSARKFNGCDIPPFISQGDIAGPCISCAAAPVDLFMVGTYQMIKLCLYFWPFRLFKINFEISGQKFSRHYVGYSMDTQKCSHMLYLEIPLRAEY